MNAAMEPTIPADLLRQADEMIAEGADLLGRLERLIARYHKLDHAVDALVPAWAGYVKSVNDDDDEVERIIHGMWSRSGVDTLSNLMAAIARAVDDELASVDAERRPVVRIAEAVEWRRQARVRGDVR